MSKKTVIKLLSFCLMISFFLPIFDWRSQEMTGLNFVLSAHIDSYKYFLVLIPISSLLLFLEAENEHSLFFRTKALCMLPLISTLLVTIAYTMNNDESGLYKHETIFRRIDIGFWLILIFSSLLLTAAMQRGRVTDDSRQHRFFNRSS